MIILPIGHDELTVRRLPWVTLALALVCIGVQVRASVQDHRLAAGLTAAQHRLEQLAAEAFARRARSLGPLGFPGPSAQAPERKAPKEPLRHHLARFPSEMDDALRAEVEAVRAEIAGLHARHPVRQLGFAPATDGPLHWLTYAFAHGGWLHLVLNLLLLYLVGCNLEDRWGRLPLLGLFLCGAVVAALTFLLWHPTGTVPLVGASGAIAAAMGAFLVFFWGTRIRFFYWSWVGVGTFEAPSWFALLFWFADQALLYWVEAHVNLGVAYSAHVGGFTFGLVVALVVRGVQHARRTSDARKVQAYEQQIMARMDGAGARRAVVAAPDNDMEQALALAGRGMALQAFALVDRVVRDRPEDLAARVLALRLAAEVGDESALERHAAGAFALWVRAGEQRQVVLTYRRMRAERPGLVFGERALLEVIGVGRTMGDPGLMLDAAAEMEAEHPESRQAPRVLWLAAEAQVGLGRSDHATATLRSLITRYPTDPLAILARRKLESPDGVGAPF